MKKLTEAQESRRKYLMSEIIRLGEVKRKIVNFLGENCEDAMEQLEEIIRTLEDLEREYFELMYETDEDDTF